MCATADLFLTLLDQASVSQGLVVRARSAGPQFGTPNQHNQTSEMRTAASF